MSYGLALVTPPAAEPVTLAEVKSHLRVDLADDDVLLGALITAARKHTENVLGRALVASTWKMTLDGFQARTLRLRPADRYPYSQAWRAYLERGGTWGLPEADVLRLPLYPVVSISAIQYVDTSGVLQTLSPNLYVLDATTEPARILPSYGQVWPATRAEPGSVRVSFLAGNPVTTIAAAISAGTQAVTPASMVGIAVGGVLSIDTGADREDVAVTAITASTFTAAFAQAHATTPVAVNGVPETLRLAVKLLAGHWYEHREALSIDGALGPMPLAVDALIGAEWNGVYV